MVDNTSRKPATRLDRRDAIKLLSGAGGAIAIAGCLGDDDSDGTDDTGDEEDGGNGNGANEEEMPDSAEVWAWDDPGLQPIRDDQAEEFEEMYDMEFTWEVFPFGDYLSNMTSAVGGGNAPDAGAFSVVWIPEYGSQGTLANVEEEFGIDPDQFVEAAGRNASHDGELVTVPWYHDCRFLCLDRDAFDDAGIEVPDLTHTPSLEEFEEWLLELQSDQDDDSVFVMDAREGFEAFFLSNGGSYLNDEGTECTLNEPEVVEVAEFLQRHMNEEGTIVPRSPDTATDPIEDFLAGEMQMYYSGLWQHERLEDGDIDWQWNPMPVGPESEESHTWSAGVFYGVPIEGGADPTVGQAWCEYIISEDVQSRVAELTGLFPATSDTYDTDRFQNYIDENEKMETAVQEIEHTVPFPDHPEFPTMWEEMTRHAEAMWFDDEDPQETLDDLAEEIESML